MKKLFTLLVAATGFATATELQDITKTITWDVTEAGMQADLPQSFTETMEISVVVTLNWKGIKKAYDYPGNGLNIEFFTINGDYSKSTTQTNQIQYIGTGFQVSPFNSLCNIGGFGGTNNKLYQNIHATSLDFNKLSNKITSATLVFTMDAASNNRRMYLQLWDEDYELIPLKESSKSANGDEWLKSMQGINYNPAYVNNIQIYSGIIPETLAQDYAYNLLTIPEPTTATLSLLALAALVARRRR